MASAHSEETIDVESKVSAAFALGMEPEEQQLAINRCAESERRALQNQADEAAYRDLLAQKAALEAELRLIVDELRPLRVQLEELDRSIAEDEAELPMLEAAMMDEVRQFLAMTPKFMNIRPGA